MCCAKWNWFEKKEISAKSRDNKLLLSEIPPCAIVSSVETEVIIEKTNASSVLKPFKFIWFFHVQPIAYLYTLKRTWNFLVSPKNKTNIVVLLLAKKKNVSPNSIYVEWYLLTEPKEQYIWSHKGEGQHFVRIFIDKKKNELKSKVTIHAHYLRNDCKNRKRINIEIFRFV